MRAPVPTRPVRAGRAFAVLCALVVALAAAAGPTTAVADTADTDHLDPVDPVLADAPPPSWPAPDDVDGQAVLLMEVTTGQLLVARNPDEPRPVASTLKLLTAYTAIRRVALDEVVTVGDEVLDVGGAGVGLAPGDEWTVEQLLDAIIGRSGNDAAEALAVHVAGDRTGFLRLMEADAAGLGVDEPRITSPSGLDDDTLLSARDLAVIGRAVLAEPELRAPMTRRVIALPDHPAAENRNELIASYPGATGMKTGFTSLAGHSLVASAERGGRELIAVVLGAGEDPSRFDAAATLLDHGFDATRPTVLGTEIGLRVAGGQLGFATDQVTITVPEGADTQLELRLPVRAPEQALTVPIVVDGEVLAELAAPPSGGPAPLEDETGRVGRALVDGTYAALRAAAADGTLG